MSPLHHFTRTQAVPTAPSHTKLHPPLTTTSIATRAVRYAIVSSSWEWLIPHAHPLKNKLKACQVTRTHHPAEGENTASPTKRLLRHLHDITWKHTAAASRPYAGALVSTLTLMILSPAAKYRYPSPPITMFATYTPPVTTIPRYSPEGERMATPPGAEAKTFPRSSTLIPSGNPTGCS